MTFRQYLSSTVCAALIAASAGAMAADGSVSGKVAAPTGPVSAKAQLATDIDANTLIGQSVVNQSGETVGEVDSVIIDSTGNVRALVVGVGGFLGIGERDVALGWNDLAVSDNGTQVRITATQEQLKQMPAYEQEASTRGTVFEDAKYAAQSAAQSAKEQVDEAGQALDDMSAEAEVEIGNAVTASTLIGSDVVNGQDKVIGEIDEILITPDGKVSAVLGTGGVLGLGEKKVVVDWHRMDVHKNSEGVVVRVALTQEDLEQLSGEGEARLR